MIWKCSRSLRYNISPTDLLHITQHLVLYAELFTGHKACCYKATRPLPIGNMHVFNLCLSCSTKTNCQWLVVLDIMLYGCTHLQILVKYYAYTIQKKDVVYYQQSVWCIFIPIQHLVKSNYNPTEGIYYLHIQLSGFHQY